MAQYSDPTELAALQRGKQRKSATGKRKSKAEERQDVAKFTQELRLNIDASWRESKSWREKAIESYGFVENEQWEEMDRQAIKNDSPFRPILTFNDILPIVRILSGIERQAKEDFKIIPRTGADIDSAKVMTECFRYVSDQNRWFYQRIRKSNDVNITGKGYVKVDIGYDDNVNGDIIMRRRNPLAVFEDPVHEEWDGSDRKWVGEGIWVTEDEAKELWPEFEDQIKVGDWLSSDNGGISPDLMGDKNADISLFLDNATKRVRIFDYWYKKREVVTLCVRLSTGDVEPATQDKLDSYATMMPDEQADHRFIRRMATVVRVATFCNWILLQDKESPLPHNNLPICKYIGLQFYKDPYGIVEYLKDPARLKNKAISQGLNHLNRSANSGWLNHATEGADPDILSKFGSAPGVNVNYKSVKPEMIQPAPISAGHFTLAQFGADQIKQTSLVNAELQGSNDKRVESGVAIERRQQGGLVGNEDLFDNGLLGDLVVGPQVIACIQHLFTPERVHKIVENVSMRDQAGMAAMMLQQGQDKLPGWIDKALEQGYDYIVDRSAALSGAREQLAARLVTMIQEFSKAGSPAPISLVKATVKQMDIPESTQQEIVQELEQMRAGMMPPGMQAASAGMTPQ